MRVVAGVIGERHINNDSGRPPFSTMLLTKSLPQTRRVRRKEYELRVFSLILLCIVFRQLFNVRGTLLQCKSSLYTRAIPEPQHGGPRPTRAPDQA